MSGGLPLECLLPGTCGHLWLCLVMSDFKWPCYSRILTLGSLAQMRTELGHKEELDRADMWRNSAHPWPLRRDERTGVDRAWV
jgi:hypothetical protein